MLARIYFAIIVFFPFINASAITIDIDGLQVSKVHIFYTDDEVVKHFIDFTEKEINTIADIKFEQYKIKSRNYFVIISSDKTVPDDTTIETASEVKDDGFLLQIAKGDIRIIAKEPMGLIYGLCEFLNLSGFR